MPFVSKDDTDRRVVINTIGPIWDLNETWLIVAGAAMFAAFPEWYSTMFSGFYLALLLILVALILRGVSFEYRHQGKGEEWTKRFDTFIVLGSFLPPFLWGVAFTNLLTWLPIETLDTGGWVFTGTLLSLLNPYALLGGLTLMLVCFTHGSVFLTLKADGVIRERSRLLATRVGAVTVVFAALFLLWTLMRFTDHALFTWMAVAAVVAGASLIVAWLCNRAGKEGLAFALNTVTIFAALAVVFLGMFPNLMVSSVGEAHTMSIVDAASSHKTLTLMTWVAVGTMPLVLAYQGWTYWVFKKRISRESIPA